MRLLEIISEGPFSDEMQTFIDEFQCTTKLYQTGRGGTNIVKLVIQDDEVVHTLKILDAIRGDSKACIYNIEGTIGITEEKEDEDDLGLARFFTSSKEELRKQIISPVNLSWNFLIMVIASSFVAGIGILQQNVAIVIGAMVIAPFLGPSMLIAFGTTLGDIKLIRKGIYVAMVGTLLAVAISFIWGLASSQVHAIDRTYTVTMQDVLLALSCGVAGALSQLGRQGTTLVGVMVAAALLPPLISGGLYLGGGYYDEAWHKIILFFTNVVCLVSSGIIVFYLAGITPSNWWEKDAARDKTKVALIVLGLMLLLLMAAIYNLNAVV